MRSKAAEEGQASEACGQLVPRNAMADACLTFFERHDCEMLDMSVLVERLYLYG